MRPRRGTDVCLNCGCTRRAARFDGYECAIGYFDQDGEFCVSQSWARHRWGVD